jgi:hypothetical protein
LTESRDLGATVQRLGADAEAVGREEELSRLEAGLAAAQRGERSVMVLRGPPGIGKTTLLEAFLARARRADDVWIARGQAIEQYGAGEAYLPLLEALGRLGREPGGQSLVHHLRRCAPTWLAQLPSLLEPSEHEALVARSRDSTRERMLRELADLLEAATAERALVLALEDLLERLTGRTPTGAESPFALLVGTYRPAVDQGGEHPRGGEIRARRRGEETGAPSKRQSGGT